MVRYFFISICIVFLFSCSFRSPQYELLKDFISSNRDEEGPVKNWTANWMDKEIDLFAINYNDQVIFADEQINIFYKDYQIYKVMGLYSDVELIDIKLENNSLEYIVGNETLSVDYCDSMIVSDKQKQKLYTKKCYHESSKRPYLNQITLNSDGLVIGLRFKIRPNYPPIELKIKQNVHYN